MNIDPFDVDWIEPDPTGRDVVMLKSIAAARDYSGRHKGDEHLSTDEVKEVVSDPDFIEESVKDPDRHNYYLVDETLNNPYARVTVACYDDENRGIAISWSRYKKPVETTRKLYERPEK